MSIKSCKRASPPVKSHYQMRFRLAHRWTYNVTAGQKLSSSRQRSSQIFFHIIIFLLVLFRPENMRGAYVQHAVLLTFSSFLFLLHLLHLLTCTPCPPSFFIIPPRPHSHPSSWIRGLRFTEFSFLPAYLMIIIFSL